MDDSRGFGQVQREVMRDKAIPPQAKALYALLASYAGKKNYCFPSVSTLCEDLGLSKPMIVKYLALLEERGIITKTRNEKGASNNAHKYVLGGTVKEEKPAEEPVSPAEPAQSESKADLTLESQKLNPFNLQKSQKLSTVNLQKLSTVNFSYKGRIITLEKEHTKKEVRDFFGIKESVHFKNFARISDAIDYFFENEKIQAFYEQFSDYKKYKSQTGERIHSVETFLGGVENGFSGEWSSENWEQKMKVIQNKGQPVAVYAGSVDEKVKRQNALIRDVD